VNSQRPPAPIRFCGDLRIRHGHATPVGIVTSGGFGVSLGALIAIGYVPTARAAPGTRLFAEVRGKRLPIVVSQLPFVPTRYKRP
jgi:aminomethyltransferase